MKPAHHYLPLPIITASTHHYRPCPPILPLTPIHFRFFPPCFQNLSSIEYAIVIPFVPEKSFDISSVIKGCALSSFLTFGGASADTQSLQFEQVSKTCRPGLYYGKIGPLFSNITHVA